MIMAKNSFKIFSFFSGSGFLDLGFEKNGFNIKFVNEYSKAFIDAYQYSRKKIGTNPAQYGYWNTDINEYLTTRSDELSRYLSDAKSDGSLVGFIGGPPCPDFSVGGKNKGRHGDNGRLSLSYVNLIIEKSPDFFLFENVKGLWRTTRHREFYEELKDRLHNSGYITTERLTNSLEFAVPQDRDRILLVGIKKELLPPKHYSGSYIIDFPWEKHMSYTTGTVKSFCWPDTTPFVENNPAICPTGLPEELTVEYWFQKNDVLNHPNGNDFFMPRAGLVRMQTVDEGDVSKKSYKRLHRWRYSPTAAYGNNEVHLHPYKSRRLSAAEALAIQSLPREFELPEKMSLSNKFKTIGNGVPFLLSLGISLTLKEYLEVILCKE